MVDADTDGCVVLAADAEEGNEALLYLPQLGLVLLVGVLQMAERAGGVDIVAGIDAHLLDIACCHVGHIGIEVDIGHQRCHEALQTQLAHNVLQVLGLASALCGETHQFASHHDDALGLFDAGLGVVGVGGGHRLDADGVVAADGDITHLGDGGGATEEGPRGGVAI